LSIRSFLDKCRPIFISGLIAPVIRIAITAAAFERTLPRWRTNPPTGFLRPCEPTLVDRPPAGPGWLHEIKHDGFRILARKQGDRVQLWSRRGAVFTYRFPAIAEAVRGLACDSALIDGEAVVLGIDGRSDFASMATISGCGRSRRDGRRSSLSTPILRSRRSALPQLQYLEQRSRRRTD
jgi:ATP-dependent DNA ligase